jgi:hypothetical protein
MPKIWVLIEYPTNPHPVDPYDAYKAVVQAVADEGGTVDEMLFDMSEGSSYQYLLITTRTTESSQGVIGALSDSNYNPKQLGGDLMTLAELPPPSSAS